MTGSAAGTAKIAIGLAAIFLPIASTTGRQRNYTAA